jgi:hypothetical protein
MQIDLPVTALQVQNGESFDSSQIVQTVVNLEQCENFFPSDIVQFLALYAEA